MADAARSAPGRPISERPGRDPAEGDTGTDGSRDRRSTLGTVAIALTSGWLVLVGWLFLTLPAAQIGTPGYGAWGIVLSSVGVITPIALIWLGLFALRMTRSLDELRDRARDDGMVPSDADAARAADIARAMQDGLRNLLADHDALAAEVAALRGARTDPEARPDAPASSDSTGTPGPLPPATFIQALNFPVNERDAAGFDVLRQALRHPETAGLVNAAQDVLTLLAQDGIYMDDLTVDPADPVLWRAFAADADGPQIDALGDIRDRSSLALTAGRLTDDAVFRTAVAHFLRTFDKGFRGFAEGASDDEIRVFAQTRTARAFLLCARSIGPFD